MTAALDLGTVPGINGDVSAMGGVAYADIVNQCGTSSTICTGDAATSSNTYFGDDKWGTNFQYLDVSGSATLGSALGFYSLTRSTASSQGTLVSTQYANAAGVAAYFLLNADGTLQYVSAAVTAVPVPAALWLLLSGLGGLGVVGRRRQTA